MKATVILALLGIAPLMASAQGFINEEHTTCYSWNGGNHSSGSFIECKTVKAKPVVVAAAPLPPPVQPSPVMMPMSAPAVQQTCAPPPKPVIRKKRPPKKVC